MKPKSKNTVCESTALGYLGSRTKAIRSDLRELPHELIDRGRARAARRYRVEDVLKLRRARSEKFRQELALLKELDTQRQVCRTK